MENTQRVWILYVALLTLNFLNANEQNGSCWDMLDCRKTTELNHPIYFKAVLTLEWKSENVLYWGESLCFCFHRKQKTKGSFQINED